MLDVPRILVVNRQPILAEALALLIHQYTKFQTEFCLTYNNITSHITHFNPQVILLILQPPDGNEELHLCSKITGVPKQYRIAALATHGILQSKHIIFTTFESGADGIINLDNVCSKTFITLLQTLAAGQHLWNPCELRTAMAKRDVTQKAQCAASLADKLTTREHEILTLMARGLTNAEVADQCGISERTVQKHVSNLLAKLAVGSRTKAVANYYDAKSRITEAEHDEDDGTPMPAWGAN